MDILPVRHLDDFTAWKAMLQGCETTSMLA
jgi:hypothetical protein